MSRTSEQDIIEIATIARNYVETQKSKISEALEIPVRGDIPTLVEVRIDLMLRNGLQGILLVFIVLALFLNLRLAFWVAIGIPTSFLGALGVLYFFGGSINMISLFGLIMALGIIVDDAIVVAEDALTHYQTGENSLLAAEGGALRMLAPVMSSSLTTVAAFFPLMLVTGIRAALLHARAAGQGQALDVAMTDGAALMMAGQYGWLGAGLWDDTKRGGNALNAGAAWSRFYSTYDGGYVSYRKSTRLNSSHVALTRIPSSS